MTRKEEGQSWTFKAKRSTLKLSDVLKMVRSRWIGHGFVEDACGLKVPLGLVGLDRIDPEGGYRVGNVRLLLTGLNLLKNNCIDDSLIIGYLNHLKSSQNVRIEAQCAVDCGELLPLEK